MPKNKIERRAFKDLEKLKKRKRKKEYIKKYEKQQKRLKNEREKLILRDEIERRKLVLGVHSTNEYMDGFKQIVFDIGDPEVARYEKWQKKIKKDIELYDFDEEEYRDQQGVILFVKKYSKLLKFLFKKYANSGYSIKDVSNFEKLSKKAATINVPELGKLLKDHGVDYKEITQKEITKLVQLVSTKMMRKNETKSLNYDGFIQFILQVAHVLYTRDPHDMSHLPPVEHIKELIKRFRSAAKGRGESTALYQDPDITVVTDKDVLRELNFRILENPHYPLPDGYYKVQEKEMKMYYELPEYYDISESQKICTELIDEWLFYAFGFHFLEPIARFETVTKVKPSFKKLSKPLPSTIKPRHNPKLLDINPLMIESKSPKRHTKSRKREVKPKLSLPLKLLVAQTPFEERAYVNEVAEVLEEILQASENGLHRLPPRDETRVGHIMNRIRMEEKIKRNREDQSKEKRDIKIKQHHSQLRKDIERKREEKRLRDEQANKLAAEKRKLQLEKERKKELSRKRYLESQKNKLNERKQKEMEELKSKTEAEEKKNKMLNEKLQREKKQFLKDQRSKLKKVFNERTKEREDLKRAEVELEYEKEIKKKRIMENMVNYLKDHKDDKEIEMQQRKELNRFYSTNQEIFEKHDGDIKRAFTYYSKQNAKTLDDKLDANIKTIDMQEFVKFGKNTKIVPKLMTNDTLLHIYRTLAKERMEKADELDDLGLVLDYDAFK